MSREFFWIQMNYRALVPELRGLMTTEGLCKGCGHEFLNERDIQIEHIEAPRRDCPRLGALARPESSALLRFVQPDKRAEAVCAMAR